MGIQPLYRWPPCADWRALALSGMDTAMIWETVFHYYINETNKQTNKETDKTRQTKNNNHKQIQGPESLVLRGPFVFLFSLGIISSWSHSAVNIMPEIFENVALFLRLGLPSTLMRRKRNRRNLITLTRWLFVWKEDILKTGLGKNDDVAIITWFSCPRFTQTQIQNDQ